MKTGQLEVKWSPLIGNVTLRDRSKSAVKKFKPMHCMAAGKVEYRSLVV
jgi:hypothetical protein